MRYVLIAALALAACSAEPDSAEGQRTALPANPVVENAPSPTPAVPAPTTLAGEWRIAGIDDESFDEPYGLALSANETELWWDPRCAGIARRYTIEGNRLTIAPVTDPGTGAVPDGPQEVCAIGLPPRIADVTRALDSADRIETTPSNGVRLSGGGHSLVLFSQ